MSRFDEVKRSGYLGSHFESTTRVRIMGDQAFITIKGLRSGISRAEFEYEIPVADAEHMLEHLVPDDKQIRKLRYTHQHKGFAYTIDVFVAKREGGGGCQRLKYELEIKRSHEIALSSRFSDVVEDLSDFIIHNCEGYKSESAVRKTVGAIVKNFEAQGADSLYVNRSYVRDINNALDAYTARFHKEGHPQEIETRSALQDIYLSVAADKSAIFDKGQPMALSLLKKSLPKLTMKGLRELLEDSDADVQLTKPFSGLDLSGLGSGTFRERMNPDYVRYRLQEQGDNFHEWLGNSITAYVYTFIQYRHEQAYRNALIAFAETEEAKNYPEHAVKLLKDSRLRLYQGESLDAGDPSNHRSDIGL